MAAIFELVLGILAEAGVSAEAFNIVSQVFDFVTGLIG